MQFIREKISEAISGGESINRRLILVVSLGVAAVAAILFSLNSPRPAPAVAASTSPLSIQLPDYFVHVVGEVGKPGVYDLPSDSRVFDAVFAAGGFTNKADQSSVNLARAISDGEQIIVLAKGMAPQNAVAPNSTKPISLNRGSQAELENLPGVGPTLASRIIDWRLANGGFKKLEDLKRVTGIGNKLFMQIKEKATL